MDTKLVMDVLISRLNYYKEMEQRTEIQEEKMAYVGCWNAIFYTAKDLGFEVSYNEKTKLYELRTAIMY